MYIGLAISGQPIKETKALALSAKMEMTLKGYDVKTPFDVVPRYITEEYESLEILLRSQTNLLRIEEIKNKMKKQWGLAMGYCLGYLITCDVVYLLNGWTNSKGATIEGFTAEIHGIRVMTELVEEEINRRELLNLTILGYGSREN